MDRLRLGPRGPGDNARSALCAVSPSMRDPAGQAPVALPLARRTGVFLAAVVGLAVLATAVVWTGAWRYALRPFCIRSGAMTPERLGFHVTDTEDTARVNGVCEAFAGGFNAMVSGRSGRAWLEFTANQPVLFRPFAAEGAATGFSLRRLGFCSPRQFERALVERHDGYRYLQYVGLGFWYAMRGWSPARVTRRVAELDPLHGMLCWDGYGFKSGFFDYENRANWQDRFDTIPAYGRNVAHQGVGRSLWFRFMGRPAELIENVRSFGKFAPDVAAGVGLAAVFTTMDAPERGDLLLETMPEVWHDEVLLGMCFAYKARSINDSAYFARAMSAVGSDRRSAVESAIAECDAIESEIRADGEGDGYRRWREGVRGWLREHVVYPFVGLKTPERVAAVA